ncbi:hypothetical protein VTJ83DRAFT_7096 [Remersonia thermophila]|uniref:F-box domain-containing protein n=1 Tax=Remersonia thermophila TaxID=72144 RepID=A0ABR4D2I1_9PEZI
MAPSIVEYPRVEWLRRYVSQKKEEYKHLHQQWLAGASKCQYAPGAWPPGKCLLTSLPMDLFLLVCDRLYQADLLHLAIASRRLCHAILSLLYTRDVASFDCLSVRWACTLGVVTTLERALQHGASPGHVFHPESDWGCRWTIRSVLGGAWRRTLFMETPLNTAIVTGEPEIVRLLLARGVSADGLGRPAFLPYSQTVHDTVRPIHFAIGSADSPPLPGPQPGNPKIVRYLLEAGADPNTDLRTLGFPFGDHSKEPRAFTPLIMALHPAVPLETVRILLDHGADPTRVGWVRRIMPDSTEFASVGALLSAATQSRAPLDMDKLELLLAYGAVREVTYACARGGSRFAVPVLYRFWGFPSIADVLQRFIAHGADLTAWAKTVMPPILSVIWWAQTSFMESRHKPAEERTSAAQSIIQRARELITLMAEATQVDTTADEPVQRSSIIDDAASHGDLRFDPYRGQTPLQYVCGYAGFDEAESLMPILLRYGADINARDAKGRSPLHHAAAFGQADKVRELVLFQGGPQASGLVVDARDSRGWTPLHYACMFSVWETDFPGAVAAARLLIDRGADARAVTPSGWTPLSLAVYAGNPQLVYLLLVRGAAQASDLYRAHPSTADPAVVGVGRLTFLTPHCRRLSRYHELGEEITARRQQVAMVLERHTGYDIPFRPILPVEVPHGEDYGESVTLLGGLRIYEVDMTFSGAIARLEETDISSEDVDLLADDILDTLYNRDGSHVDILFVEVDRPKPFPISWAGRPSPH